MQEKLKNLANENKDDWVLLLPFVIMGYNFMPQESIWLSLRLMVFGEKNLVHLDVMVGKPLVEKSYACKTEYIVWLKHSLNNALEFFLNINSFLPGIV